MPSKRTNEFSFVSSWVLRQNCNLLLFHFVLQLFSRVNIALSQLIAVFFNREASTNVLIAGVI